MAPAKKETATAAGNTRDLTAAERREKFLKLKSSTKPDWRIIEANSEETFYPYGFITLDQVLGLRGMTHQGRVVHIHGNEHAGKTTLSAGICANYQKLTGEGIVYLDFEGTLPSSYFGSLGVDEDMAFLYRPESIDDACIKMLDYLDMGTRLFVCNSIPRMRAKVDPKDIRSGKVFKHTVGNHAKAITQFYEAMLGQLAKNNATIIMINQQRDRIDDSPEAQYASKYPSFTNLPYILPGGRANRFYSSVMIELKTKKTYRAGGYTEDPFIIEPGKNVGDMVATESRARSLKNKNTGGGHREGTIWHRPGFGIDENISVRQLARTYGFIDFSGRRYFVGKNIDEAIKVYDSKDQAIQDLVVTPNEEVLGRLRALLVNTIDNDDSSKFAAELTTGEKAYLKGEGDENAALDTDVGFEEAFEADPLDELD
jgi:RecA/RadA recombinase